MPELPEVETTCRGIAPHVTGQQVTQLIVRQAQLRWPVPSKLPALLKNKTVREVTRRAKYLLIHFDNGTAIMHLGMSGSLRIVNRGEALKKHDHIDFELSNRKILRYHDPRRFGALLWQPINEQHSVLSKLGPEPLSNEFNGDRLFELSRKRKAPVKTFIMDNATVVGVGNIYANEALFNAGIRPDREAGRISRQRYLLLGEEIKQVLAKAIQQGGTTLRDFVGGDGKPGYFQQTLNVYGRGGENCPQCGKVLKEIRLGQRSTVFCSHCQR
jgi:formamidopyrimidine-DNA glycosylase